MMKKLIAMLLTLVMCLSMAACGGADKQPAIDAFNATSNKFNAMSAKVNENIDLFPDETISTLTDMANLLNEYKDLLQGDTAIEQEKLDEIIAWFGTVDTWVDEVNVELENLDEVLAEEAVLLEQAGPLAEVYDVIASLYNEALTQAETNGWLNDELTVTELEAVAPHLELIGKALTEDIALLADTNIEELIPALQELEAPLKELIERVSVPYGSEAPAATNTPAAETTTPASGITEEQLATVTQAYSVVAPLYNEALTQAEANGWANDEATVAELQAYAATLEVIGTALTEDLSLLEGADFDELAVALTELEAPLTELVARVSSAYVAG